MSNFEQLILDSKNDPSILNSLTEAEDFQAAASKAQALGYSVTAEELEAYLDSEDVELPAEVLSAVAGGRRKPGGSHWSQRFNAQPQRPNVQPGSGSGLIAAGGLN